MYKTKLAGEEKTCRVEALCGKLDLGQKICRHLWRAAGHIRTMWCRMSWWQLIYI